MITTPLRFVRAPSLVGIDAPLVAVSWQSAVYAALHLSVPWPARAGLFLTTWVIYLFDRIADAVSVVSVERLSARQAYARSHIVLLLVLLAVALVADAVVVSRLDATSRTAGAWIAAACAAYLVTNRCADRVWNALPMKELSIGALFAVGCAAPRVESVPLSLLACLALLFALDCIAVAAWERALDEHQGKSSLATRFRIDEALPVALGALATAAVVARVTLLVPVVASALGLWLLHATRSRTTLGDRTALADLILVAVPLVLR